jgi:hypothetical protein
VSNNDIKVLVDHANNIALHSASASGIGGEAILTELKKVDGLGSGLDSDLLDGMESSAFVQKSIVTAANDFIVGTGASAIAKKTLAETKVILNVPDDTDVIPYGGLTTGIPNSFVVTTSKAITLTAGRAVCAKMHAASSGPCVLNWNGAGAKSVKKPNGNDPNLKANGVYTFRYDGTNFILQGEGGE